jgi:hypothetical protein
MCWVVAIALLCTHAVLAYLARAQAITTGNDDALYLLLARSVRSFRYLDSHLVGAPLHSQYPPGYPAFLALFGNNFQAAVIGSIVASTVALLLAYDLFRRALGPVPGLFVLAALAVNPPLVISAGSLRSESLFMATVLGTIWCASRTRMTPWWLAATGTLAVYAAMVRTAGIALVCAVLVLWLIQRRFRAVMLFGSLAGLIVGGWLVLTAMAPGQFYGRSYAAALQRAESAPTAIGVLVNRFDASLAYFYKYIPGGLWLPSIENTSLDNFFWILMLVTGLALGVVALWRKFPMITGFLIFYAVVLTLYPFKLTRFIVPILPLLVLAVTTGLVVVVRRLAGRGTLVTSGLLSLLLIAGAWQGDRTLIRKATACGSDNPWGANPCSTPIQRGFFAAADYARTRTPPDATFLTLKEATFALLSDRRVEHPERIIRGDSLGVMAALRAHGVDYVLISPIHTSRLSRMLLKACGELELLRTFPVDTYLFRLLPSAGPGESESCRILRRTAQDARFTPPVRNSGEDPD